MSRLADWFARNRKGIGIGILAMIAVAQADSMVRSHPRAVLAMACVAAYITAAGAHKSDGFHREQQGRRSGKWPR